LEHEFSHRTITHSRSRWASLPFARPTDKVSHRHRDRLHLRVELQRVLTEFAADARHLEAAKRSARVEHVEAVQPNRSRSQPVRPVLLARVDVAQHAVHLLLRNLRSLFVRQIERIANLATLRFGRDLGDELVVHRFLYEQPTAGTATLALVEEQPEVRSLDG